MKLVIELPENLAQYADDIVDYAMEAIRIKHSEAAVAVLRKDAEAAAEAEVDDVSISGETWKDRKKRLWREKHPEEEGERGGNDGRDSRDIPHRTDGT